jgi:hypothetical protein
VRAAGTAFLLLYLAIHLALLPRTLEDLDSINFALGVRHFDVAQHQPHPPGYPVYIALSKASTATLRVLGVSAAAPRGLAIWSALGAAAALPAIVLFFTAIEERRRLAVWTAVVTAAAPLFWFTGLRPLSDMAGFAAAIWALALFLSRRPMEVALGALVAGLGIGIRSQIAVLTLPLLAWLILAPRRLPVRARVFAVIALVAGVLVWAVPLVVVSGGLAKYLAALGSQAGEDFSGVTMLWTQHSVRQIAAALFDTFIWPWDWWLGVGMCVLAGAGALRVAWRAPRAIVVLAIAFVPYAVFHLLFQETVTTRYALPLVPVVAYLAVAALETRSKAALPAAAIAIALVSLLVALPASVTYAIDGAPIFQAFDDMAITAHGGERVSAVGMHASARRAAQWAAPILPAPVVNAPHGREWLALVSLWRSQPESIVWFAADPKRTDLALFDGHTRDLARAYRWGFVEEPFVGGARPNNIDWYRLRPPGWMLDEGWSITPETAGIAARDGRGPAAAPVVAWVRSRESESTLVLGGRYIADATAAAATISLDVNGGALTTLQATPGFFVQELPIPAGTFTAGSAYVPLEVRATVAPRATVSLEQFDVQAPGVPMIAFESGWQEPEYNPASGAAWRWMSERSVLWVRPIGRAVTLRVSGESTRKYYDHPPRVRLLAGDREIAAFDADEDFDRAFTIPADALAAAGGRLTFVSSAFFVPGGGSGGDQRHLSVRIYSIAAE